MNKRLKDRVGKYFLKALFKGMVVTILGILIMYMVNAYWLEQQLRYRVLVLFVMYILSLVFLLCAVLPDAKKIVGLYKSRKNRG